MITPTPRFHVHALVLAVSAMVLLNLPMIKMHAPIVWAMVITLSAAALIYGIAAFFEAGAHILTKLFTGVAIVIALVAAVLAWLNLDAFSVL